MKTLAALLIAFVLTGLSACSSSDKLPSIKGNWVIDLDKTLQRAEDMRATAKARAEIMRTYSGWQLEITDDKLFFSIRDEDRPPMEIPYSITSSKGNCVAVKLAFPDGATAGKFCIVDGYLEAIGSVTEPVEIYRRVS